MKLPRYFIFMLFIFQSITCYAQNGLSAYYRPFPGLSNMSSANNLVFDNNDFLWVGSRGMGIAKLNLNNNTWVLYDSLNSALPSNVINSLSLDSSNNILISTKLGLSIFDGFNFTNYNNANTGIASDTVYVTVAHGNNYWLGTYNGLSRITGGIGTNYTTSNSGIISNVIIDLVHQLPNFIWISTAQGVSKFDYVNNLWQNFPIINNNICLANNNDSIFIFTDKLLLFDGTKFSKFQTTPQPIVYDSISMPKDYIISSRNKMFSYNDRKKIIEYGDSAFHQYDVALNINIFKNNRKYVATDLSNTKIALLRSFAINDTIYIINKSQYVPPIITPPAPCWECWNNNNTKYLDINKTRALIANQGGMHFNNLTFHPGYEVPKDSAVHAVYASHFWIGGLDGGNNLHLAANTYYQVGYDFRPGPLDTISGTTDTATATQYNRIWNLWRDTINEFKNQYALGNVQNGTYAVNEAIINWPAHGAGNFTRNMAPFVDVNGDNIYNYLDGDYPKIKGDECVYFIFNDNFIPHTNTVGAPMQVEVHGMAYSFECMSMGDDSSIGNYTTFYHYDVFNRSTTNYNKVQIGMWCDMDLGFATDDYVGCDSTLNIGFTYNGDPNDEGGYGYGLQPPVMNVAVLKGPTPALNDGVDNNHDGIVDETGEVNMMNSFMYYNNINNFPTGNPQTNTDHYNYLNSTWLDGQHLTYGQDGRNVNSYNTNFMYSGDPATNLGWTELNIGNSPDDRRFILASGPFDLDAGATNSFDCAYIFTRDDNDTIYEPFKKNTEEVKRIKFWFANDTLSICDPLVYAAGISEPNHTQELNTLSVFPNPGSDRINIRNDKSNFGDNYFVADISGRVAMQGKISKPYIDIKELKPGFYFLKIFDENKSWSTKFIKL
ncbi:MAG: T9SS type A sorting domain-containing protein [Bacteroidetes bacterium]|nr:T9SS type A sorting domain-containing protein [Bacteroidota bacterium]